MKLTTTKQASLDNGIKILVHGLAGAGKTYLCRTIAEPAVIISAESGLLSLRDLDIPVIEITNFDDMAEAYRFVATSKEAGQFQWVVLDSLSEIAEQCLAHEKKQSKDNRLAYMATQDKIYNLVRVFRNLPKNVYFSCKMEKLKDDASGSILYTPSLPGSKLGQALPYFFDFVFALRVEKNEDGTLSRYLQTKRDHQYDAKDRSDNLPMYLEPNLGLIKKYLNTNKPTEKPTNKTETENGQPNQL